MISPRIHADLTYEPQQRIDGQSRTCGAAALAMAYRAWGATPSQPEIWRSIAHQDPHGRWRAPIRRMACDALARGYLATLLQVERDPWGALQQLVELPLVGILSHRLSYDSPWGHYSVLVGCDQQQLTLHDPLYGPDRKVSWLRWAPLWQRQRTDDEIAGMVLLVIGLPANSAAASVRPEANPLKGQAAIPCRSCGLNFPLAFDPKSSQADAQRCWTRVFCPHCDHPTLADAPSVPSARIDRRGSHPLNSPHLSHPADQRSFR